MGVHRVVIWSEGFETYHSTRFLIREALKGIDSDAATDAPQYVYVRHPGGDPAACGVSFDNGVEYRIFANLYKDKIYTSLCSFSTNAADPDNAPWEDYRRAAGMADALAKEQP
ncbi:MAG: hypothetical protein A3E78_16015 [Alphaproteobacteria bacterium RIFCSPHIGHO2_12_FULL_63_12]|nr:MAG: hypothetical protein A3E78_16015 [Alphaproteobacteria bacterium RIFCSPHIGHO2_12_FULL_63_12]